MAVSETRDYELLLDEGREQEKKCDWIAAVEPYNKASNAAFKLNDFSKAAEIHERIGFCHHRAAMQAKNLQEFKNHMLRAINEYNKAAELYEKIEGMEKLAKIGHCKAVAAYISSRLKSDVTSRKKLLDESWKLEKEAFKFYEETDDRLNLGKTCNELSTCLIDRLNLEWNKQAREKMLREALSLGEKAIGILSELGEEYELARAYFTTSIHYYTAALGLELGKKSKYEQKALSYSKKAVELYEKIGDRFLFGMSNITFGEAIADFEGNLDSAVKCFENALQCGIYSRDNYLIGYPSFCLAYTTFWKMITEEDPDKIREESKKCEKHGERAVLHFSLASHDQEIAFSYSYGYVENYSFLAMNVETSPEEKRNLLKQSIEAGRKGLEHARRSGSIRATWVILHPLSKCLFFLSTIETDTDVKKRLLKESLLYRKENIKALEQTMPYYFWNQGVYHNYLALIQAELAEIEKDKEQKVKLLKNAIKSAENCINLCLRHGTLSQGQYAALGRYYSNLGGTLNKLYLLTGTSEPLNKLVEAFKGAIEAYEKADLPSHVAESYWQLAKTNDKMQNYAESAINFEAASKSYEAAAKKLPRLKDFYSDYATYMQAWNKIEKAKHHHARQEYGLAIEHFEKAANIHESLSQWGYLAPNYLAWSQVERAEDLSRREKSEEATQAFEQAAKLFNETKKSLRTALVKIESLDEKQMVTNMVKVSDLRHEYCIARIALEEAKILDKRGDDYSSSEKYGSAVETFEKIYQKLESEQDRKEIKLVINLSRAWQKMTQAEAEASPVLYAEASQLFEEAKDFSPNKEAKMLALGYSRFCRALEAGTKFADTRDAILHASAIQYLESAANYYLKAGLQKASDYAKATGLLFDAYVHMDSAKKENDPEKKAKLCLMAEKVLQTSADFYMKAEHPEKREQVLRLLEEVKEERELAVSLTEVLHAPLTVSTTAAFATPIPTHEKAVGLEKFEHANIQAYLTVPEEVTVGETFEVRLDMTNVAKEPGLLVRIENLIPSNFKITETTPKCKWEDGSIDGKGKRLEPQKLESVRIRATASESGIAHLSPRIVYVDELGKFKICQPDPAAVAIYPLGKFQFKTNNAQSVFEYLTNAFIEDYMRRKLTLEKSGWRTFMQIVKNAKISKSSMYGTTARRGPAISELERRGVVEIRIFPGERGRGGQITKTRVTYEKDIIKRYVDQQVMKIKEK